MFEAVYKHLLKRGYNKVIATELAHEIIYNTVC